MTTYHLYGPPKPDLEENGVVVLCLVRNGALYLEEFISHYFSRGAEHIIFLDNGSTDATIELARDHDRVSVYRTDFPFQSDRGHGMREWLIANFGQNRWSLRVDIDEFFDYPFSDRVPLKALIGYLNSHAYTAVVTQVLDLFPAAIYRNGEKTFSRNEHRYYTPEADVAPYQLEEGPALETPFTLRSGGKRKQLFGTEVFLTKHPLLLSDEMTQLSRDGRLLRSGRTADFSAVLLHYKFTNGFFENAEYALRREDHRKQSKLNRAEWLRADFLKLKNEGCQEYRGNESLLESGYLNASERFKAFAFGTNHGQ